jgi:hypothetical protein
MKSKEGIRVYHWMRPRRCGRIGKTGKEGSELDTRDGDVYAEVGGEKNRLRKKE